MSKPRYSLAVVALHPIQYQAGLWRSIAEHPRFELRVLFLDRIGIDGSVDPTMAAAMKWDVPLLEGYDHEFVRNLSPLRFTPVVNRVNPALASRLRAHPYDAIVIHGWLPLSNWLAVLTAKRAGSKVVYRGEGSLRGRAQHDSFLVNRLKHPLNALFLRSCDAIAYSSEDNRRYQLARGAPADRLFPMPCAVDNVHLESLARDAAAPLAVRARLGLPEDARVVVNVGRFAPHKCVADCIAALAAGPLRSRENVHLLLVGDGPLRGELEAQARDLGLRERVHFLGFLGQKNVVEILRACDAFLIASSHGDPSPKALSEALYLGLPAVCSRGVGTCEDLVSHGENGFVYPTGDREAMATAIADILDDDERRKHMEQRSHEIGLANDFRAGVDALATKLDEITN